MNPNQFIELQKKTWAELEQYESRIRKKGWTKLTQAEVWKLAGLYRRVSGHLAMAKVFFPSSLVTAYLNQLVSRTYNLFYKTRPGKLRSAKNFFIQGFPDEMKRSRRYVGLAALITLIAAFLGVMVTMLHPEAAAVFLGEEAMEAVRKGSLWTEKIWNVVPSSVMATRIFCNNISVSFMAFAFGALLGVGTVYLLFLNGLMLGSMMAFTAHYGKAGSLLSFVVAHGFLELTLICVAAAGGFHLAKGQLFPGARLRSVALKEEGMRGGALVLGSIPFFIIAGLIEGFVSPNEDISLSIKLSLGLVVWITYLAYSFGYEPRKKHSAPEQLDDLVNQLQEPLLLHR